MQAEFLQEKKLQKYFISSLSKNLSNKGYSGGPLKDFKDVLDQDFVPESNIFCLLDTVANCEKQIEYDKKSLETSRINIPQDHQSLMSNSSIQIPNEDSSLSHSYKQSFDKIHSPAFSGSEIIMKYNLPSEISCSSNSTIQNIVRFFSKNLKLSLSSSSSSYNLNLSDSNPNFVSISNLGLHFKYYKSQNQVLMISTCPAYASQQFFFLVKNTEYKIESISFTVKFNLKKLKILQNQRQNISLEFNSSGKIYFNQEQRILLECGPGQEHDFEVIRGNGWIIKQNSAKSEKVPIFKSIYPSIPEQRIFFPITLTTTTQIQVQNSQFQISISELA